MSVVEAFQRARGLAISGVVDDTTWSRLVEAGWHLGQRLLFLARPNLRGDDVAELQVRLAQLGFNPGRIDGIFGPLLGHALSDFQKNRGLDPDGVLTRATLLEVLRMTSVARDRRLVTEARDVAGFDRPPSDLIVVAGVSDLATAIARTWEHHGTMTLLVDRDPVAVAALANESNAAIVLDVEEVNDGLGIHLNYWASYRSHSRRGAELAAALAGELAHDGTQSRVEISGMALPVLRETKMTTLHVAHGPLPHDQIDVLASAFCRVLEEAIRS